MTFPAGLIAWMPSRSFVRKEKRGGRREGGTAGISMLIKNPSKLASEQRAINRSAKKRSNLGIRKQGEKLGTTGIEIGTAQQLGQ